MAFSYVLWAGGFAGHAHDYIDGALTKWMDERMLASSSYSWAAMHLQYYIAAVWPHVRLPSPGCLCRLSLWQCWHSCYLPLYCSAAWLQRKRGQLAFCITWYGAYIKKAPPPSSCGLLLICLLARLVARAVPKVKDHPDLGKMEPYTTVAFLMQKAMAHAHPGGMHEK